MNRLDKALDDIDFTNNQNFDDFDVVTVQEKILSDQS